MLDAPGPPGLKTSEPWRSLGEPVARARLTVREIFLPLGWA